MTTPIDTISDTTASKLVRLSRRYCYRTYQDCPDQPEAVAVDGQEWLLWLDRAETAQQSPDGQPMTAFYIDRGED